MKLDINFSSFCDAFRDMGREEQFSYDGKSALFDYVKDYEEATGTEVNLDIIALCCEYSEYADIEEFRRYYGEDYETMGDIENETTVIYLAGDYTGESGFIVAQF